MKAKDIMTTPVVTASPKTSLKDLATALIEHDVSAVPIVGDTGELQGIVSEANLVSLQSVPDPRRHLLPSVPQAAGIARHAEDIMTADVVTVDEDRDVTDVARLMLSQHVKRIPVVSNGHVVGIISRHDILKVLARSDRLIQAELQQRLDDAAEVFDQYEATVEDGAVTLSGPGDMRNRDLARVIACAIPGVVSVRFDDE